MGFTLVELFGHFDQILLEIATASGAQVTMQDVHSALNAAWAERIRLDAIETWEPTIQATEAISFEIDRQACLRLGITDPEQQRTAHRRAQAIFESTSAYRLYPEVQDTLAELRKIVPTLGIISNWGWRLPELCSDLGIAHYFDFIITSARVGAAKPHPAIYQAALAKANTRPERMLHVGDSLSADVRGAQGLGITGVLLDRAGQVSPDGYPVIGSLSEVLAFL